MSKVAIQQTTLRSIGDAIRSKTGTTDLIDPLDMAEKITSIEGGGSTGNDGSTPETAYTVSEAYDYISSLENKAYGNYIYVIGTVNSFTDSDITAYGNATFTITDGISTVKPYRAKGLNNINFSNRNELVIGDVILIYGRAQKYSTTSFQISNGYIVEYKSRPTIVDKTLTANAVYYPSQEIWMPITVNVPTTGSTPGSSKDEPMSVTKAIEIGNLLADGETSVINYYIFGRISDIATHSSLNTNLTIADDTNSIYCFKITMEDGSKVYNTYPKLAIGDYIMLYGPLQKYNGAIEFYQPKLIEYRYTPIVEIYSNTTNKKIDLSSYAITDLRPYAFYQDTGLITIKLPSTLQQIQAQAFNGCNELEDVNLSSCTNLTYIGTGAFRSTRSLTKAIVIPSSVTKILDYAFYESYISGLSFAEGSQLEVIYENAFCYCYYLTGTLELPEGFTSFDSRAFSSCNLTAVILPSTLATIGEGCFFGNENLTSITFNGTMEQWNAVFKGSLWNNGVPATEVICSDGTVTL